MDEETTQPSSPDRNRPDQANSPDEIGPATLTRKRAGRGATGVIVLGYGLAALALCWQSAPSREEFPFLVVSYCVFMLRTFGLHIGFLLVLATAVFLLRRQKRHTLACLPLVALGLFPEMWSYLPKESAPLTGQTFRLLHSNLLFANHNFTAVAEEIAQANADVILLHEYDPDWHKAIGAQLQERYPHVQTHATAGSFGWAVFSRFPMNQPVVNLAPPGLSSRVIVRTELQMSDRTLALYAVHINPPKALRRLATQDQGNRQLIDLLRDESGAVLVAGDFNYTCRHQMYRDLVNKGLSDAHAARGRGRGATWPAVGLLRFAPGVRIDHVFLGGALACIDIKTLPSHGSDHRMVVAELGFIRASD